MSREEGGAYGVGEGKGGLGIGEDIKKRKSQCTVTLNKFCHIICKSSVD